MLHPYGSFDGLRKPRYPLSVPMARSFAAFAESDGGMPRSPQDLYRAYSLPDGDSAGNGVTVAVVRGSEAELAGQIDGLIRKEPWWRRFTQAARICKAISTRLTARSVCPRRFSRSYTAAAERMKPATGKAAARWTLGVWRRRRMLRGCTLLHREQRSYACLRRMLQ